MQLRRYSKLRFGVIMLTFKKPLDQYPWYIRIIFWAQKIKYGAPLEPAQYWARDPQTMFGLQVLYRCLDRKHIPLDKKLRLLASLRVSQINDCAFCFDISSSQMKNFDISAEKLLELKQYKTSELYTEQEKAVLQYADAVTVTGEKVSDELLNSLSAFLSKDGIVYLTSWICFQNMTSKFNAALDVPAQGFCLKK